MRDYSVYVRSHKNNLWWVKTFYASNYKDIRGAYKAANRYANLLNKKTGNSYIVVEDEV